MRFDPERRAREKQAAREQDDRDLADGLISREELAQRNGFFSSLSFDGSTIVRKGLHPPKSDVECRMKGAVDMAPRDHFLRNATPPLRQPEKKRRPLVWFLTILGVLFVASIALSGTLDILGI